MDDLMDNLTGGAQAETEETAEQTGDSDPETQAQPQTEDKDKFGRRIASALANQKRGFQKDIDFSARVHGAAGDMTDDEITEALRDYQARRIAESDTDISPKAARRIVEAQERANQTQTDNPQRGDAEAEVQSLYADGWTTDELRVLTNDAEVQRLFAAGVSLRKAAKMYLQRQQTVQPQTPKRGVPTAKTAGSGAPPDNNAIANMTDAEFDAFQKRVERAAMEGKRVRF
nr:MAG TPA: hypothetical protein [Caudoviricetes sp.]